MKRISAVLLLAVTLAIGGGVPAAATEAAPAGKTGVVAFGTLIDDWPH